MREDFWVFQNARGRSGEMERTGAE